MHVCIDARVTIGGRRHGIARVVWNLLAELARDGRGVRTTALVADDSMDPLLGDCPHVDLRRVPVPPYSFQTLWRVPRELDRLRPDLYHCPTYFAPLRAPCPMIVTVHDLIHMQYPRDYGWRQRVYYNTLFRAITRRAAGVMTGSQAAAADLQRRLGVPAAKIHVHHWALDPDFGPGDDPAGRVRRELGLEAPFILSVANPRPHKNALGLLQAYRLLCEDAGAPPLALVGVKRKELGSGAEWIAEDRLRCLTDVSDALLADLYAAAGVFVLPSHAEGFGLPVLEAMCCGAPVACSRIGPLMEVAGSAAVLFDPHDPADMARAIRRILQDASLADRLRAAGRDQASRFQLATLADHAVATYRRLAAIRPI